MRRHHMAAVLGTVLFALIAGQAFAEDVYVTKHGKLYHAADSRFIKGKEVVKMSLEEAEAKGYKPSQEFLKEKQEETQQSNDPR